MREPVSDTTLRDPRMATLQEARNRGAGFEELLAIRTPSARLASPFSLYYRVYKARDGALALGALTPQNRDAIRRVLGIHGQEQSDTPDFDAVDPATIAATETWRERIEAQFTTKRVDEWMTLFEAARVPVARINFPEEMTDDPQANADQAFLELEQKVAGPVVTMSATPTGSSLPAPSLGEHTRAILHDLGLSQEEVGRLERAGTIRCFD
jgi:crotonobetainyl-CoA:carnitine CoA-transferase CaiB-like acyl-CoA transferase